MTSGPVDERTGWLDASVLCAIPRTCSFDETRAELDRFVALGVNGIWVGPIETTAPRPGCFWKPSYVVVDSEIDSRRGGRVALGALIAGAKRCAIRILIDAPRHVHDGSTVSRFLSDVGADGWVARTPTPDGCDSWSDVRKSLRRACSDAVLVTDLDATAEPAFDAMIDTSLSARLRDVLRGHVPAQPFVERVANDVNAEPTTRLWRERPDREGTLLSRAAERALSLFTPGVPLFAQESRDSVLDQRTRVWVDLRREQRVLQSGNVVPVENTRPQWLASFCRENGDDRWFVAINFSHRSQPLEASEPAWRGRTVLDAFRNRQVSLGRRQPVLLPAFGVLVGRVV